VCHLLITVVVLRYDVIYLDLLEVIELSWNSCADHYVCRLVYESPLLILCGAGISVFSFPRASLDFKPLLSTKWSDRRANEVQLY
jgi:hypothetical protein